MLKSRIARSFVAAMAGLLLSAASPASAKPPLELSLAQLDAVTAGAVGAAAEVSMRADGSLFAFTTTQTHTFARNVELFTGDVGFAAAAGAGAGVGQSSTGSVEGSASGRQIVNNTRLYTTTTAGVSTTIGYVVVVGLTLPN